MAGPGPRVSSVSFSDPLQRFQILMPRRVRRLLLAGSRYDLYQLWEDGQLSERILSEWLHLHLSSTSWLTHVTSGQDALDACSGGDFDLVVATPHLRDMSLVELGQRLFLRHSRLPVVPLAFDDQELIEIERDARGERFERPFLWQGDFRLLLGIVQSLEDRWNVAHDTESVGVSVIILIEDRVDYYSMYLPKVYQELNEQSEHVIAEGTNLHHKIMRLRARPKILHCTTFEQAETYFHRYRGHLLGVISDVHFPWAGGDDHDAGIEFAAMARREEPNLPILLQSHEESVRARAEPLGAQVVMKDSKSLLTDLRSFMRESFGFGPFLFKNEDGEEIDRAYDLNDFERRMRVVPGDVIRKHADRHHFSTWLRARTEFGFAERLRPIDAADFPADDDLREFLVRSIRDFRRGRQTGSVIDFSKDSFDPTFSFARIGGGSLGGKARGLGFVRSQLLAYGVNESFDVEVHVPPGVVLATDIFDRFLHDNGLHRNVALDLDDAEMEARFVAGRLPIDVVERLTQFLSLVDKPLAVRSSSLLEDSQKFSLTGVYGTFMIPNNHPAQEVRVRQLVTAIKRVYAGTWFRHVKSCFEASPYVLEEEKMAVLIQVITGTRRGSRYYPDFAGVARSHNVYPTGPMKPEDGIVQLALGLGEAVVGGGKGLSFSPRYPRHPVAFSSPEEILENAQTEFYALDVDDPESAEPSRFGIDVARQDGALAYIGSTWSPENARMYDGVDRKGVPVVTFAPILKNDAFPLADILTVLLEVGSRAMNLGVEVEFAGNCSKEPGRPHELAFLQLRPISIQFRTADVDLDAIDPAETVCWSRTVLGGGRLDGIRDLVVVDPETYDRAKSREVGAQIAEINARLVRDGTPYVLIGVGRWGSADPWLGITVQWSHIAGARVIVESEFRDYVTAPSQGSHFFQNLTSNGIGYFSTHPSKKSGGVDWEWLRGHAAVSETPYVRHLRVEDPMVVVMDGARGCGVVMKPGAGA